ncbi:MAG: zinc ribbon domain-containing protein [Cyanobacteria bacterium RUI128]|nr:zinc ribbon domain-containing protein [Cyanobacteria bacterium RUI128]
MFCPNCGKEISDSSKYCLYCGHKFEENTEDRLYSNSYYKDGYIKKNHSHKKQDYSFGDLFLKGVFTMLGIFLCLIAFLFLKNFVAGDIMSFDKMKYEQYIENPSLIPELTQPETLSGFIDNLKDVQTFLELYLKLSDDDMDTKLETFDKYRKELLKVQNFDNSNLLDGNVRYQVPRTEKEFNKLQKQYAKTLSKVGLKIVAEDSYSKYHLAEDTRFTYKKYGKYLPSDIREYLKLRADNYKDCMHKDELIIKPYELAKRIGDFERFMNANKDFRYAEEVRDYVFSYTFIYSFTSDRTNMIYLNKKLFVKSDKKFMKNYPDSQLKELFSHLASSANGISEKQFDDMYPYKYQKNLDAIKPEKSDLTDIFATVRKNIMKLKSDANFQYTYYAATNTWAVYDPSKPLKKGDMLLAQGNDGYEVYDNKYKKANQTIQLEENAKFFIKNDQLYAYSPKHLQIQTLDISYGSMSFRTISVKAIKAIFPDVLIINIDTFGESSVQIDKPAGAKTYMLISTSGGNYEGYRLSGNITIGELSNIFTVSDDNVQVSFTSETGNEDYHMYFITQQSGQREQNQSADPALAN